MSEPAYINEWSEPGVWRAPDMICAFPEGHGWWQGSDPNSGVWITGRHSYEMDPFERERNGLTLPDFGRLNQRAPRDGVVGWIEQSGQTLRVLEPFEVFRGDVLRWSERPEMESPHGNELWLMRDGREMAYYDVRDGVWGWRFKHTYGGYDHDKHMPLHPNKAEAAS